MSKMVMRKTALLTSIVLAFGPLAPLVFAVQSGGRISVPEKYQNAPPPGPGASPQTVPPISDPAAGEPRLALQTTATPAATESPSPSSTPLPAGGAAEVRTPLPDPSLGPGPNQDSPTDVVLRMLVRGVALSAAGLIIFGAYTALRPRVRSYWGRLRTRRMHRSREEARRLDSEQ